MNNTNIDGRLLKDIAIFSELTDEQRSMIAGEMKMSRYNTGDMIFREGDPGEVLFVVISGAVTVFIMDHEGKEVVLAEIKAGSYVGEMSIIDHTHRSAACRVISDCVLLELHADDFLHIMHDMPQASSRIMKRMLSIIVERLMKTGAFITQMVQWGEESRKRAITDPATGLFNRRYLEDSFDGLVAKAKTSAVPLSFVMFDLDRFGSLNTMYGQEFCDGLIVEASVVFRAVFAQEDILVRYGGDEFIFIFPGSDSAAAQVKCDALCAAMREMRFAQHPEIRLTCSMGYATLPDHAAGAEELKDKSDKALYRAKEEGRDRAYGA
ncbi:MAG TPA: GGDEF domain-containing protein [Spirochaetota bacterium]|nr:GGDEF domain-containing protein [Spirochaetota bacterium]